MDLSLPALSLKGVVKVFQGVGEQKQIRALDNLNYELQGRPAVHGVAGPDGAGKSTLAALSAGMIQPDEGEIRVFGMKPNLNDEMFLNTVSYLPQQLGLYRELPVWENLNIFASIKNVPKNVREKRFKELLAMTGLTGFEHRPAGKLSGGMRQKLSLACALVGKPKLLILDEPTVGVDPLSRLEISKIITSRVQEDQMYCLLMTTLLSEAAQAESVMLLQEGKLLASGTPSSLTAKVASRTYSIPRKPHEPQRRQFDRQMQRFVRAQVAESPYLDVVPSGEFLHVLLAEGVDANKLDAPLTPRKPELEDAYCALTLPNKPLGAEEKDTLAPKNCATSKMTPEEELSLDVENNPTIIETRNIVKKFGDFTAVQNTSFQVKKGEIFGLLGPNGAGKTTTFRMMCGLSAPTSGEVFLEGKNLNSALSELRMRIGYAAQKFSLYDLLSVEQNLLYFGQSYGLAPKILRKKVEECLQELDLQRFRETQAGLLPLGAKRSLTMAVALINSPDILFLDEPTSGADTAARREFWRRIAKLSDQGTTTIVTTHFMEEAEYCDRFLIQDAGKILVLGSPQAIRAESLIDGKPAETVEQAFAIVVDNFRRKEQAEKGGK